MRDDQGLESPESLAVSGLNITDDESLEKLDKAEAGATPLEPHTPAFTTPVTVSDAVTEAAVTEAVPSEADVPSGAEEEAEKAPAENETEATDIMAEATEDTEITEATGTKPTHKVTLEDEPESEAEPEPEPTEEPEDDLEDDFGDFGGSDDDFDSFEAPADVEPEVESTACGFKFTFRDVPHAEEKLRELLPAPGASVPLAATHLTPTSQMLWTQLMASPEATLVEWNRSAIHRRLAVALGAPLDLDQSLPKVAVRDMALPAVHKDHGLPDTSAIVNWRILTTVSAEALAGMSDEELQEHMATLRGAIEGAQQLSDDYESAEMEFLGEKEVLEGMVESLLVYAQKSQRSKLSQRSKKK